MARRFWLNVGSNPQEQDSKFTNPISTDVEAGRKRQEYLEGYAELSEFIASDNDFLVFRKFGALSARNLLYLQAEVQVLEGQLKRMDEEDRIRMVDAENIAEKMQVDRAARDWEYLTRAAHEKENGRQAKKMEIIIGMRQAMKQYRMQFLTDLSDLSNWFQRRRYCFKARSRRWNLLEVTPLKPSNYGSATRHLY